MNMIIDLKIIKNKYGEKMMHLCRKLFPTLLETPYLLSDLMLNLFEPTKELYNDIIKNNLEEKFKNYIYKIFHHLLLHNLVFQNLLDNILNLNYILFQNSLLIRI